MLISGGTNRSLKMEVASCSTTGTCLGLDGPSRSIPDSSLDPLRDDRSLKRLDFLSEPLGEAVGSRESVCQNTVSMITSAITVDDGNFTMTC